MGKLKRERKKYHLSPLNAVSQEDVLQEDLPENAPLTPLFPVPENVFAGVNISFDEVTKSLKDSDVRSVKSTKSSKSTGGSTISKKEKRKLRHEAFIKKLEATYQATKEIKKLKKNKNKSKNKIEQPANEIKQIVSDNLPSLDLNLVNYTQDSDSKKLHSTKKRSIPKAKYRKRKMLQDIAAFGKLLKDEQFKTNPIASVSKHIQSKAFEEVKHIG